jgi:hypothetical protein
MLEGKIGDFSLPDIFQLITLTKKSGSLNITTDQQQGRILFKGGEICFAVADVARVAIGARLVQSGLASEEQVLEILEARRADGEQGNLSQSLLEAADVDDGALDAFIRASIEDAVFDLMRLPDASFSFDASDEPEQTVGLSVSTEHLIIEGGRRMGEWTSIREVVPSSEAVLALSPDASGEVALTAEQWPVLALVDGRRTVAEIVDLSGRGEFATSQVLSGLVALGVVEVVSDSGAGALSALFAKRDKLRRIEELELGGPKPAQVPARRSEPARAEVAPRPTPAAPAPVIEPPKAEPVVSEPATFEPAAPAPVVEPTPVPESLPEPQAEPVAAPQPAVAATPTPSVEDVIGGDGAASPAPAPAAEARNGHANGQTNGSSAPVDRSQVARELASLGLDDDQPTAPVRKPVAEDSSEGGEPIRRLTRDEDVNKGLLLRLIDGVKGA